jgi:hypothetical protein
MLNTHDDVIHAGQWLRRHIKPGGYYTHTQLIRDSGCHLWALLEAWGVMRELGERPAAYIDWGYEGQVLSKREARKYRP